MGRGLIALCSCNYRLSEAETKIIALKDEKKQLEISLSETEGGNQVLRDEHQALQIAYASIEEKLKILHVSSYIKFSDVLKSSQSNFCSTKTLLWWRG